MRMSKNNSVANLYAVAKPKQRYFRLPYFLFSVQAGFTSPADGYIEKALDMNDYLIRNEDASFIFRISGQSMHDAGILDGDKVVVDRSIYPRHGDIVIAVVDGDFTIKRLFQRGQRIELHPENPEFRPIVFREGQELKIWGVVVSAVRRYF